MLQFSNEKKCLEVFLVLFKQIAKIQLYVVILLLNWLNYEFHFNIMHIYFICLNIFL